MKTKSKVQPAAATRQGGEGSRFEVQGREPAESKVSGLKSKVSTPETSGRRPAAADYLSRFLCVGFALALLATGCASPRPLKGGRAVTTHKPAGVIEQTLVQSENPAAASKQDQESVKVRTYTVRAGSRMEQTQPPNAVAAQSTARISASPEPNHVFAIEMARTGRLGPIHTVYTDCRWRDGMRQDWLPAQPEPTKDEVGWDVWLGSSP